MPFKDLTGQKFGELTVIRADGKDQYSRYYWLCVCSCGNYARVKSNNLRTGNTKRCGCGKTALGKRVVDLTGQKFAELTVVERDYSRPPKSGTFWKCECSCGVVKTVARRKLVRGETLTCGIRGRHISSDSAKRIYWAEAVRDKADNTCEKCGENDKLHAHHILSYTIYPELRYDEDNGSCLCVKCHKEFHSKFGIMKNTRQDFLDWLISD